MSSKTEPRTLRVVVASPGDVQKERDLLPRVIDELNRGIAGQCRFRLELHRWETDAYPGFHAEGPQGLIDPILKIEESDIVVGIFWKRFGTPTSDGKTGTEHELDLAVQAREKNGRPQIMVYFNEKAYSPKSKDETDQWGRVLEFQKHFPKEGLWWPYKGPQQFETLVRNHLTNVIRQLGENPPEPLNALHQLLPPPPDFTGREAELTELRKDIEGGTHILGLQGQGGVGKTALALKLAEELSPKYPDAQIYMDLRGVSEKPLTAAEALAYVVRACHPEVKLPESEAELRAVYLSLLHGKKAILVMDNARDRAQVDPLIPPSGCVLLITSRNRFALPGLQARNLDNLSPADAERLLLKIQKRIGGEAASIARLCGYLPLALRLAGSALTERPNLSPSDYAVRLEKERLKLLAVGERSVEASISLPYSLLDPEAQKRWRVLGVFSDTFDTSAAAAVWEVETGTAEDILGRLVQISMLEWNDTTKRYRLHDLMRDFARLQLNEAAEAEGAARRHARYYLNVLSIADELYREGGESINPALALFDLEWSNIQAGQAWVAAHAAQDDEAARLCSRYPDAGAHCLDLRQHPREQVVWSQAALVAARFVQDREAETSHLGRLGNALDNLGQSHRALELYQQQLDGSREFGYRKLEGNALGSLGNAYTRLGETQRAIRYYEQALAIAREIGDLAGERAGLGNLGVSYKNLGEVHRAIEYFELALAVAREIGDPRGIGLMLNNLGVAFSNLGESHRALEYFEKGLTGAREIGDRRGQASALGNLGNAHGDLGQTRQALEDYIESLALIREVGDPRGEGIALFNIGLTLDKLGDRPQAIKNAGAALKILDQAESPHAEEVRKQLEEWKDEGAGGQRSGVGG